MVAASQPLAVAAGLGILAQGGNAADAAVAVAAALNVTEPTSTGIGGDCFALYFDAETRAIDALNASGRAPAALSLERLRREGFDKGLPPAHPYTITVPGACAGWCDLLARHGRLALPAVLAPAIRLAQEGFLVAPLTAYYWQRGAQNQLLNAPGGRELTLDGRAPRPGEIFRNPGLARTLSLVAEGGKQAFYQGILAEAIVETVRLAGGCLSLEDLAAHRGAWETPISVDYRGYRLWECPPNGQGLATLLGLNLLAGFDLAGLPPLSPSRLHLQIEAMRLAFADARYYVADPDFRPAPLDWLLSEDYARQRRALIDPQRASPGQRPGPPQPAPDTVYFSVVDAQGNACSFINSNYIGFGTGIVPSGWGFTLQNRGLGFDLDPQHPNALAPRKRPYHTIIPALLTHATSGELFACYGVMGGYMQPQGHLQVAVALIDDRLDPQAALDRPRFCLQDGTPASPVALEPGIPARTRTRLLEMGHQLQTLRGYERSLFGRGQVILRDSASGALWGGSDPRADGCAMSL
ncbi:MAG: gamma-glutamyltransferase family protein [Anaerolineales bacterium]|nr:gamma-glutamyltransferase family protein [Anaerolineales bacterium]